MKFSNIFGILLLLIGVAAGVLLVQNVQDFRERAAKPQKQKVCHKTGSAENPYVSIEVDEHALKAHIDHGDTIGDCPDDNSGSEGDGGSGNEGDSTGGSSNNSGSSSGSSSNEGNNSNGGENVRVVTETRYVYLNPGTLEFYIKFFGVDEKREDKSIRVELRKVDEEVHIYEDVPVTANVNGVYKGTLREVPPGGYDIYLKSLNHLQERFEGVDLQRGFNRWYWNERELLPGDMDLDNDIDVEDLAIFLANYTQEEKQVDIETTYYDVNFDGVINKADLELILQNYNSLMVEGDS